MAVINVFKYPCDDEILHPEWAGDFLRQLKGYPEHTDQNYIRNQRDACNVFIDWLQSDPQTTYSEMLQIQHQFAACGQSKNSFYSIRLPNGRWIMPQSANSCHILYSTQGTKYWRETYPGQFRSSLEMDGILHPATDVLRLKKSEWSALQSIPHSSAAKIVKWPKGGKVPICEIGNPLFVISFSPSNPSCSIHVDFRSDGTFIRKAPLGVARSLLFSKTEKLMDNIKSTIRNGNIIEIYNLLSEYYHSAINLMPFSNINNSLFFGQLNSILRICRLNSMLHGSLDSIAMLSSNKAFSEYFISIKNKHQVCRHVAR